MTLLDTTGFNDIIKFNFLSTRFWPPPPYISVLKIYNTSRNFTNRKSLPGVRIIELIKKS